MLLSCSFCLVIHLVLNIQSLHTYWSVTTVCRDIPFFFVFLLLCWQIIWHVVATQPIYWSLSRKHWRLHVIVVTWSKPNSFCEIVSRNVCFSSNRQSEFIGWSASANILVISLFFSLTGGVWTAADFSKDKSFLQPDDLLEDLRRGAAYLFLWFLVVK